MYAPVPLNLVDVPKKWRKVVRAVVNSLADSFAKDGLLQPIGVRPSPDKAGRYVLVYGRHRLEAAKKNGWAEIDAKVISCDEDQAAAKTTAENLFRTNLTAGERIIALKDWSERYKKQHPEVHGQAGVANARWRQEAGADEPDAKPFASHVEDTIGLDKSKVHAYLKAGKDLDEEQLGVLAEAKASRDQIRAVNDLTAPRRAEAVALVASGMPINDAIVQAQMPEGATVESVGEPPESPAREDDLSDEEWLTVHCGEVLDRLKYRQAYARDALLYRHTREARFKFRNATKKALAQARAQVVGPLFLLAAKLVNLDHPKNWLPCAPCGATGQSGGHGKCPVCNGHAYSVKTGGGVR